MNKKMTFVENLPDIERGSRHSRCRFLKDFFWLMRDSFFE